MGSVELWRGGLCFPSCILDQMEAQRVYTRWSTTIETVLSSSFNKQQLDEVCYYNPDHYCDMIDKECILHILST